MKEYIDQALRTESVDLFKVDNPRLLHAAFGINTEVGELLTAEIDDLTNVKEEVGDVLWYVAIAADELEASFDELKLLGRTMLETSGADVTDPKTLFLAAIEILDLTKRALFYGVDLDEVKMANQIGVVLLTLEQAAFSEGLTLDDAMDANIRKLAKRYPGKFTTEAAVNRDLDTEREELGK